MTDDVDRAQLEEERWLACMIQAARGIPAPPSPRTHCHDCGDVLEVHRLYYGICVDCQTKAETLATRWRR